MFVQRYHLYRAVFFCLFLMAISVSAFPASFIVNSSLDNDNPDDVLTLREAINFAQGFATREPFDDPDPDAQDELALITGDTYGTGIADTVTVALSGMGNIVLTAPLPTITQPNDIFQGGTIERITGTGIPNGTQGWAITADNTTIQGFTLDGFSDEGALDVSGNGCRVGRMRIENSRGRGLVFIGVDNGEIFDLTVDNCTGIGVVLQGSTTNTIVRNTFIVNGDTTGLLVTGVGTSNNRLYELGIGVDSDGSYKGNSGFGITVDRGATNNIFGPPGETDADDLNLSYVAANAFGGIEVAGSETANNTFYSIVIGGTFEAERNDPWPGNGTTTSDTTGHGLLVHQGANNNQFGQSRPNSVIAIGGHVGNGIMIRDIGTNNNSFNRCNVGWVENLVSTIAQTNQGHGIEIQGGVEGTEFGFSPPEEEFFFTHVEVNFTGEDSHGIFLNGNDTENPIRNTLIEHYHAGDRMLDVDPMATDLTVFGGDAICVEGNVDGTTIGLSGHPNTTNGATGYGIRLKGENVKNVELRRIITGERFGFPIGNKAGGIMIEDGASKITFSGPEESSRSYISGNAGPGITVDATESRPEDIVLRNVTVGFGEFGNPLPNEGSGILIVGDEDLDADPFGNKDDSDKGIFPDTDPTIIIGSRENQSDNGSVRASGNNRHGIEIKNIRRVNILNSLIGPGPLNEHGNAMDGINISHSAIVNVGLDGDDAMNVISGNSMAGIKIQDGSRLLSIGNNVIGLSPDGMERMGNDNGIHSTALGPPGLADFNNIGSGAAGGNIISGNDRNGILLGSDPDKLVPTKQTGEVIRFNIISNNLIGPPMDGGLMDLQEPDLPEGLGNIENGILLNGPEFQGAQIGSTNMFEDRNIISGNQGAGIKVSGGASTGDILRNYIGFNQEGDLSHANQDGIVLEDVTDGNIFENVISCNRFTGIVIIGSGGNDLSITKNIIGTDPNGIDVSVERGNVIGIYVENNDREGMEPLTIGTLNASLTDTSIPFDAGDSNIISSNAVGILLSSATTLRNVRIIGNIIGASRTGGLLNDLSPRGRAIALNAVEMNARGQQSDVSGITIGGLAPGEGNLIGPIQENAFWLRNGVTDVDILANRIGLGSTDDIKLPIERSGVLLDNGPQRVHIENNVITSCEINGIELRGANTRLNTWRNNSIYENQQKAVSIFPGANDGISAPRWKLTPVKDQNLSAVPITVSESGELELSIDPIFSETGQWGQGKEPQSNIIQVDSAGETTIDFNTLDGQSSFVTAVFSTTDGSGELLNSSEYSPIIDSTIVQAIDLQPDLLVAGKPAIIRSYIGPFLEGSSDTFVSSRVFKGDNQTIAGGSPVNHILREYGFYAGNENDREMGSDSLNAIIPTVDSGLQDFLIDITDGITDDVRIKDLVLEDFQETNQFLSVLVPIDTPAGKADLSLIPAATAFMADVYPASRRDLIKGTILMPSFRGRTSFQLDSDARQARVDEYLNNFVARFRKSGRPTILGGGIVNSSTQVRVPGVQGNAVGFTYPSGYNFVFKDSIRDTGGNLQTPGHPGQLLAHEIGHSRIFQLGDTYVGGDASSNNPRPTDPTRVDSDGILLREDDNAYSPTGSMRLPGLTRPRPLFTPEGSGTTYRDFMSSVVPGDGVWTEPVTYRHTFGRLGGRLTGSKGTVLPEDDITSPMYVMGTLNLSELTFDFDPVVFAPDTQQRIQDTSGTLRMELRNDSGILDIYEINPPSTVETLLIEGGDIRQTDIVPVRGFLETFDSANEVRVVFNESLVGMLERSDNAPDVSNVSTSITKGNGGGNVIVINWSAVDLDNDDLKSEILFTPDGKGRTVIPIVFNEDNVGSATVSLDLLPTGEDPRFIVRVTDGWDSDEELTDPISLPNNLPEAFIFSPTEIAGWMTTEGLLLSGAGNDVEDGFLLDTSLSWSIDDVFVGNGELVITEPLSEGPHTIRLTVTDSLGGTGFSEIEINVEETMQFVGNDRWIYF